MDRNNTDEKKEGSEIDASLGVALVVGFFFLGAFLSCILTTCFPRLHMTFVHCKKKVFKAFRRQPARSVPQQQTADDLDSVTYSKQDVSNSYAEIDESKTATFDFRKCNNAMYGAKEKRDKSLLSRALSAPFKKANRPVPKKRQLKSDIGRTNAYEDVDTSRPSGTYCIVEPGTNRRLPVKRLEDKKMLGNDGNHLYFILEPGSDKVTPLFYKSNDGPEEIDIYKDHTYFVLEVQGGAMDTLQAEPYAVNDISDHHYFVLEKMAS